MTWVRKGCMDCKVELDESSAIEIYPTVCFKCGKELVELDDDWRAVHDT